MRRALPATQLIFAALTALVLRNHSGSLADCRMFLAALALIEAVYLIRIYREPRRCAALSVITSLILIILFTWELAAVNLKIANPILLPPPDEVFEVFADCRALMLKGVFRHLRCSASACRPPSYPVSFSASPLAGCRSCATSFCRSPRC